MTGLCIAMSGLTFVLVFGLYGIEQTLGEIRDELKKMRDKDD